MKLNKQNNFSSFWLGDTFKTKSLIENDVEQKPKVDYIKLSSYQRAISNFVNIVTAKNIPVKFSSRGESYTDGKVVTISAKLDDKLFDSSVGLALHEGSHILLSDFDFLKRLGSRIPKTFYEATAEKGLTRTETKMLVKNMLNYVEDRRIDNHIITTAPGYKGYYLSMYDKYFNNNQVGKGLKSDEMTETNLDSYMFRIINFTNTDTNLDALPGLRDIWNILDLRNISRLTSTGKAFQVAYDMSKVIINNLDNVDAQDKYNQIKKKINQELASSPIFNDDANSSYSDFSKERIKQAMDKYQASSDYERLLSEVADEAKYMGDKKFTQNINKLLQEIYNGLTDDEKSDFRKRLDKVLEKQKKFLDGKISKRKLSKKDIQQVNAISESGTEYKDVLTENRHENSLNTFKSENDAKVIVVNKFTKSLVDSDLFPNAISNWRYDWSERQKLVLEGLRLGKMLGKKLQIRGEQRLLKNTRLKSGRIDKRLVAELGFNNENVFHNIEVEKYPDGFLHISLDASGSMSGKSFDNSLTCAIAIQAVDMIPNFDVVFSLRGTTDRYSGGADVPLLLYAYDSRVDKISKVRQLFKHLHCGSTTPEGLCYEAVMKDMIMTTDKMDSYFLNFSDGMPMYSNDSIYYSGDEARKHTRDMVNKMRKMGIKVLSYFINDRYYGDDAEQIDILSIPAVARTMNNLFLEK